MQADKLVSSALFFDAEKVYTKVLNHKNSSAMELLEAKRGLGESLALSGKLTRAFPYVNEICEDTSGKEEYASFFIWALERKIRIAQKIQKIEPALPRENAKKIFRLIERGQQQLKDIGMECRDAGLLLNEADLYFTIGDLKKAYSLSEKSYERARIFDSGFHMHVHAGKVAKYSRLLGNIQRAVQVIDEIKNLNFFPTPLTEARFLREQLKVWTTWSPSEPFALIPVARRMLALAEKIHGGKNRVFLYAVFADLALRINYFDAARDAIEKAMQVAKTDNTNYRHFLLRALKADLIKKQRCMTKKTVAQSINTMQKLFDEHITDIDRILAQEAACKQGAES